MKKFQKLTPAEKRIAIAQDIIAQIKASMYKPRAGIYTQIAGVSKLDKESGLKEALEENKVVCTVCALGAAFCSLIKFDNQLKIGEIRRVELGPYSWSRKTSSIDGRKRLEEYFSNKQLGLIESAFEKRSGFAREAKCTELQTERASFYRTRLNLNKSSDALISICENIIKNNGTFKP